MSPAKLIAKAVFSIMHCETAPHIYLIKILGTCMGVTSYVLKKCYVRVNVHSVEKTSHFDE